MEREEERGGGRERKCRRGALQLTALPMWSRNTTGSSGHTLHIKWTFSIIFHWAEGCMTPNFWAGSRTPLLAHQVHGQCTLLHHQH